MIIDDKVYMTWNSRNKRHFESKGYLYTKQREGFYVKPEDLQETSHFKIHVACDICGKESYVAYRDYLKRKTDKYLCSNCALYTYGIDTRKKNHIANGNSLGDWCIENIDESFVDIYWSDKNAKLPFEIAKGSDDVIFIKCPNGHADYQTTAYRYTSRSHNCPECVRLRDESFLQEKVRLYLEEIFGESDIAHERKCTICPINPKTNQKLPFDNEVISQKLIVEVMGLQHYQATSWAEYLAQKYNTTPSKIIEYQQEKDLYKKNYALSHGYYYLDIPYWAEKDDKYKELIDNKLQEMEGVHK